MITCPNKNLPEWQELEQLVPDLAYTIWDLNNGNGIDKAPNGAESILFRSLLEHYNGDRNAAIQAKSKVYSNEFREWFGDWVNVNNITSNINKADKSLVDVIPYDKPWKSDPSKINKTLRIYLKDHSKGYFELVKDEEYGIYSIHFKTKKEGAKYNGDWENSTKEDRKTLFKELVKLIPEGAQVSTWGELSDEGVIGLNNVGRDMTKVGERVVSSKVTGGEITIPVYQKGDGISKVVDENGEPLVVYHGGAQNIDKFRNSSELERSNTGSGYYTDKKTGEKIPVDSDRTIFFSTSRGTASSYALTYAIQYFNTLYHKVNSLIGTTHEGKLQVDTKYIKDVDALYDLLDKLYEFNPRYTKLKEYIQKVKSGGQTLNEKEVKSFRDMLIETRQDLELYTSEWNLNISKWEEILNISKNILERYNNKEGIQDLKNGQVPDYMLKQFDLYEKINEDRERLGYEKISNYDNYTIFLSNLGLSNVEMLIYDGKTLTARNDRLGLNQDITTMSEEQIKRFLDIAQQDNYTSLENYSKDKSSRKLHSKSQIYSAFLNVRNPLSHDYNGTMQGQGYKQNKKQDFGYVAARQVNKAIKEGNDGVVYKNLYDPYLSDNYGVFNSEQIKTINENKSEDQEGDQIKKYCKGE